MKKYRTKSGKVEEKLPGINATVSPSEKVQIAMAGGANTLGDVQTILGISGKKNNLKGQGAKHLVSFNGDEGFGGDYGGYDTGPSMADAEAQEADEYANYLSDTRVTSGGPTARASGLPPSPTSPPGSDPDSTSFLDDLMPDRKTLDALSYGSSLVGGIKAAANLSPWGVGFNIASALATYALSEKDEEDKGNSPAMGGQPMLGPLGKGTESKEDYDARMSEEVDVFEEEYEEKVAREDQYKMGPKGLGTVWDPEPSYPEVDSGDDAPKKKKLIRAAANGTTLAVADSDDYTREDLRRARRQITRFA